MSIRVANPEDVEVLVELGRRTFHETFAGTCPDSDMQLFLDTSYAPAKIASELAHPRSCFLLMEDSESIFGYSRVFEEDEVPGFIQKDMAEGERAAEIVRFYLDRRAFGTGAAQKLMDRTLELCRERGYRKVYLGVWEKNYRAQRFYEKAGFGRAQYEGEKIFMVGTDAQVDWYYVRDL